MSDVDDFLAHHGVKGMHWGKTKLGYTKRDAPTEQHRTNRSTAKTQFKTDTIKRSNYKKEHVQTSIETPGGKNYLKTYGSAGGRMAKKQIDKKVDKMIKNKKKIIATTAVLGTVSVGLIAASSPKGREFLGKSWDKVADAYNTWNARGDTNDLWG